MTHYSKPNSYHMVDSILWLLTLEFFIHWIADNVCLAVGGSRVNATKCKHNHLYWNFITFKQTRQVNIHMSVDRCNCWCWVLSETTHKLNLLLTYTGVHNVRRIVFEFLVRTWLENAFAWRSSICDKKKGWLAQQIKMIPYSYMKTKFTCGVPSVELYKTCPINYLMFCHFRNKHGKFNLCKRFLLGTVLHSSSDVATPLGEVFKSG